MWSFQLPLREVDCLPLGHTVRNWSRGVSTPPILSPYGCFSFSVLLHQVAFGFAASDLFTIGGEGVEAGRPPFRTSKSTEPVPLVGGLEEPALLACREVKPPPEGQGWG